jgi:hypothetical protein
MGNGSSCCQQQQLDHVSHDESSEAKISQKKYDLTKEEKKASVPPITLTFGAPSILSSNQLGSVHQVEGMTDAHELKGIGTQIGATAEGQPTNSHIHDIEVHSGRRFGSELHPTIMPRSPGNGEEPWQNLAGGFDTFAGTKITQGKSDLNTELLGDTKQGTSSNRAVSSTVGAAVNPQPEVKKSAFFNPSSAKHFEKPPQEAPHELSISRDGREVALNPVSPSSDEVDNRDSIVGRKSSQTLGVTGQGLRFAHEKKNSNSMLGRLIDAEDDQSNLAMATSQDRLLLAGNTRIENGYKSTALDEIDRNFDLSGIAAQQLTVGATKPDQRYLESVLQDISQVG